MDVIPRPRQRPSVAVLVVAAACVVLWDASDAGGGGLGTTRTAASGGWPHLPDGTPAACERTLSLVVSAEARVRVAQDTQGWSVHRAVAESRLLAYADIGCPLVGAVTAGIRAAAAAAAVRRRRGAASTPVNQITPLGGPVAPPRGRPDGQRPLLVASPHADSNAAGSDTPDSDRNRDGVTGVP